MYSLRILKQISFAFLRWKSSFLTDSKFIKEAPKPGGQDKWNREGRSNSTNLDVVGVVLIIVLFTLEGLDSFSLNSQMAFKLTFFLNVHKYLILNFTRVTIQQNINSVWLGSNWHPSEVLKTLWSLWLCCHSNMISNKLITNQYQADAKLLRQNLTPTFVGFLMIFGHYRNLQWSCRYRSLRSVHIAASNHRAINARLWPPVLQGPTAETPRKKSVTSLGQF